MKKISKILVLLTIFMLSATVNFACVNEVTDMKLVFTPINDGTEYEVSITKAKGDETDIITSDITEIEIPSVYEGKPVTRIADRGFGDVRNKQFTKIIIPNSVTSIGKYAFEYCYGLQTVTIPSSVTEIGDFAFLFCTGLFAVTIPSTVKNIGTSFLACTQVILINTDSAVIPEDDGIYVIDKNGNTVTTGIAVVVKNGDTHTLNTVGAATSVKLPNGLTSIGESAFLLSGIKTVTIPNGVTSIENFAFDYCMNLTSITIPSSVTRIESVAFANCSRLAEINTDSDVIPTGDGLYVLDENGDRVTKGGIAVVIKSEVEQNLIFAGGTITSLKIPSSVTSISERAFWVCENLKTVTIPDSVTGIGGWAFAHCKSLTTITMQNGLTNIDNNAFYGCAGLTEITIPMSVESIGSQAFTNCSALTIYAEATSKPTGWSNFWNSSGRPVEWGCNI